MFELNDETRWILGRPNFTCTGLAGALRDIGHEIHNKAEDEQAVVIYWMLCMYVKYGDEWRTKVDDELKKKVNHDQ